MSLSRTNPEELDRINEKYGVHVSDMLEKITHDANTLVSDSQELVESMKLPDAHYNLCNGCAECEV